MMFDIRWRYLLLIKSCRMRYSCVSAQRGELSYVILVSLLRMEIKWLDFKRTTAHIHDLKSRGEARKVKFDLATGHEVTSQ